MNDNYLYLNKIWEYKKNKLLRLQLKVYLSLEIETKIVIFQKPK